MGPSPAPAGGAALSGARGRVDLLAEGRAGCRLVGEDVETRHHHGNHRAGRFVPGGAAARRGSGPRSGSKKAASRGSRRAASRGSRRAAPKNGRCCAGRRSGSSTQPQRGGWPPRWRTLPTRAGWRRLATGSSSAGRRPSCSPAYRMSVAAAYEVLRAALRPRAQGSRNWSSDALSAAMHARGLLVRNPASAGVHRTPLVLPRRGSPSTHRSRGWLRSTRSFRTAKLATRRIRPGWPPERGGWALSGALSPPSFDASDALLACGCREAGALTASVPSPWRVGYSAGSAAGITARSSVASRWSIFAKPCSTVRIRPFRSSIRG